MTHLDPVTDQLTAAGMSDSAARDKARVFLQLGAGRATQPALSLFVPGRIEFLGKHTDYAGGRSLVGAIERGICFAAVPRPDRKVIIRDVARGLASAFDLDESIAPSYGTWASYGMVVARRIARNFPGSLTGAEILFASDLSPAAGMSTSSVLITGFFRILADLNSLVRHPGYASEIRSPESLAEYLGAVENGSSYRSLGGDGGVGTSGGSQDHAAILLSEPSSLLQCGFDPVRKEATVPFPQSLALVIGVSGVVAEKTGAANESYNRIARVTRRILQHWNLATDRKDPTLMAILARDAAAHQELREILDAAEDAEFDHSTLVARLEQVVMESTVLIPDAVDALRRNDWTGLGMTVDLSQTLAERMLGNQVPETIALAHRARDLGAVAASAFGAGFGGSVYAVLPEEKAAQFMIQWSNDYHRQFPHRRESSTFFETRLGPPLTAIQPA
jgi:galactokinase